MANSKFTWNRSRCFYLCIILLVVHLFLRYFGSVRLNLELSFLPLVKNSVSVLETKQYFISGTVEDVKDSFVDNWIRLQEARVDWQAVLTPCWDVTDWGSTKAGWEKEFRSSGKNSYVYYTDIRPAGEFTRIFIHTRTKNGKSKTIGGDSWRVYLKGPSHVFATVFDHQNGTYEVMALVLESGKYVVKAILDYSLCDGIKDPPEDWFRNGNAQGKLQASGILGLLDDYLVEPLQGGKIITIQIPPSDNISSRVNDLLSIGCRETCKALWNGYGRWVKSDWMPYIPENSSETKTQAKITFPIERKGTLWIYGDSLALRFHDSLSSKLLCTKIFRSCRRSYNWVYPIPYENEYVAKKKNDNFDFRPNLILESIRDVLLSEGMTTADSLLVLNLGLHLPIGVNFTTYQSLITDVIRLLKNREKELGSKAKVIWKTITAIHKEKIEKPRNETHWRFFTDQRVLLFDRYAMSAMCKAGIEILDVYHLTASYPNDTTDVVHYKDEAFHKAEMALQRYWTNGVRDKPQRICVGDNDGIQANKHKYI